MIMKKIISLSVIALSSVFLFGCNSIDRSQGQCSAANASYLTLWDCIRGSVAKGEAGRMNNSHGIRYLAVGDAIAEQVD
ncbi:MAG: hypothetical protein EB015_04960 [Methylocystaceae bacterium]|nr:hypothetical protein [Methylocystaceae bacterium]